MFSVIFQFGDEFDMKDVSFGVYYPFHIAKAAVTPHLIPLSINPLNCRYTPVRFGLLSHRASDLRTLASFKTERDRALSVYACGSQAREAGWPFAIPSALFGAPFHIDNRTIANCGFWLEYASKNLSR